jgi:dihydrofolate synthase/folylpolyglutamate synthase
VSRPAQRPLDETLERLYRRNLHTIKLGLEAVEALLRELDRPECAFAAVHVAGTNGKGSVCAMLDAIFRAAGLRVGLYTSPHLVALNERIRVNGAPIDDAALAEGIDAVERAAVRAQQAGARDVTFFEFTTALAFHYFRQAGVQLAVIETGMGGRLDATNVVAPLVAAITSIGFDHMAWLGDTLEKIAREKAGIIKPGRPVVIGPLPPEADAVMVETSRAKGAPLIRAADVCAVSRISQTIEGQKLRIETPDGVIGGVACPLLGRHQLANIAVAIAALKHAELGLGVSIDEKAIRAGLSGVSWPARAQLIDREPPTLLDGAHNPEAMTALLRTVEEIRAERPVALMAGFLADKDAVSCLTPWRDRAARVFLVQVDSDRAMATEDMRSAASRAGIDDAAPPVPLREAWRVARAWCRARGAMLVIAGSLYLAGEALRLISEGFLSRD